MFRTRTGILPGRWPVYRIAVWRQASGVEREVSCRRARLFSDFDDPSHYYARYCLPSACSSSQGHEPPTRPDMEPSFTELLIPGLKLMLVGMGIVFLFLSLLVWIIGMTARLVKNVNPPLEQVRRPGLPIEADEAELVAAIAVALRHTQGSNGR